MMAVLKAVRRLVDPPHVQYGDRGSRTSASSLGKFVTSTVLPVHNLAKVGVEGSNPFARSRIFNGLALRTLAGLWA
jgi:hypothetical protein